MILEELSFDNFMSLPSKDRKFVINNPEYLKAMIKKNVSEHRFEHSLSVADVCKELALIHKINPEKAYLAGLLHDCCKFPDSDSNGVLEDYLKFYDPKKLVEPFKSCYGAYHSWVAKYYLKEKLNFHDSDILNAIYNHTICESNDKLSLILYIADKREPLRNINDDILYIAHKDLYKAYDMLRWDVKKYLEDKNERFIEISI